jgi:antitoxin VapB
MALNIRDPEAQRLARDLARRTGETMTQAVIKALQERLERLRITQRPAALIEPRV